MVKGAASLCRMVVCLGALTLVGGCRGKAPVRPPAAESQALQHLARGDRAFASCHLYGWRQAEAEYAKACELSPSPQIREKLLLTRFLIVTRSADEDIVNPGMNEAADALCDGSSDPRLRGLCELARQYKEGFGATSWQPRTDQPKRRDVPAFGFDGGALDAYLGELYRRTFGIERAADAATAPAEVYKDSPLFLYLAMSRKTARATGDLEKTHPEFAELFTFTAEASLQGSRFNAARSYFKKALDLIPDYTRALVGVGSVYFYALEDYEEALKWYEAALKWDPTSSPALFGRGACLHHLGNYAESNETMDRVLLSDLTRRGRASAQNVRYYKVEANYYLAYNHYLMGNREKAREFADIAVQLAGYSEHVNYLSAVLYFDAGQMPQARQEFENLIRRGTSFCHAKYYLGRILHLQKEDGAFSYFLTACSCMEAGIRNLDQQIQSLPGLDVEPAERVILKGRLDKKLFNYRLESTAVIETMIRIVADSDYTGKQYVQGLMTEVLARVRPPAGTSAVP